MAERVHAGEPLILEPDRLRAAGCRLGALLGDYEAGLRSRSVLPDVDRALIRRILDEPFPEDGRPLEELFDEFEDDIVPNSTQIAHPRFLAYVLATPASIAPFAEAAAAALNQNCNLWTLSPAANAIEQKVIAWFHDLFGMHGGGGIITSGGSMANLSALAVARDTHHPGDPRLDGLQSIASRMVLYTSQEAHNSIDKAAAIIGLGTDSVRRIPTDDRLRMRVDSLREAVAADRRRGHQPFCVVASAGTVTTGAIDPIDELAEYCRREGFWLHVDGAYGAFAALSDRLHGDLRKAGEGDSLSLDPHKLLFMPLEAGCVLFRDSAGWRNTFSFSPGYLAMPPDADFLHFSEYGPQLSRSFKALKIWWCLRAHGRRRYQVAIERVLDLAAYMGDRIVDEPRLELVAPVGLTAVCFRVRDADDSENRRLLETLVRDGLAFLGPAHVRGRFCLRGCFVNLRTTRQDVDAIVDAILRLAYRDDATRASR
jgi:aromatic-L-amino-acid decarboxylase